MWIVGFFSTLRREYSSPTIPRLQGPGTLLKCRLPSLCNRSFVWDAQVWHGFLGGQKGVTVFKGCLDVAVAVALALLVILSGAPLATLTKESYKILISTLGTFFRILRKPSQEFSILRDGYSNLQLSGYPKKQPGLYNLQTFVGGCFPAFTSGESNLPRCYLLHARESGLPS